MSTVRTARAVGRPAPCAGVLHRITGVLTFFFLFAHVLDTALLRVSVIRSELQNTMDRNAQVFRTDASLAQAEADIASLKERYGQVAIPDKGKR